MNGYICSSALGLLQCIHHCLSTYITHLVHKYLFCLIVTDLSLNNT